jgi:hypothetical protein
LDDLQEKRAGSGMTTLKPLSILGTIRTYVRLSLLERSLDTELLNDDAIFVIEV